VTQIRNSFMSALQMCPDIHGLSFQIEGEENPVPLVKHVANVLSMVIEDANALTKCHPQVDDTCKDFFLAWIKKCRENFKPGLVEKIKIFKVAVNKERIISRIECVERALHHLHIALTLASLYTSTSW
jgi:hypothetical protein